MTCTLPVIKRGANQTIIWEIKGSDGIPRPFAAGEWATICFGRVAAFGSEVLSKSTNVSGEGETTVGSPLATWYLLPADGTSLPQPTYQADIWLHTAEGHVLPVGDPFSVQVEGRVCLLE